MATHQAAAIETVHGGLTRIFVDRKIGTKIAIGFACTLAIMTCVSFTAYLGFGSVAANFETSRQRASVASIGRDADREFLALRRFVREYAATGEEADVAGAEKARATMNEVVARGLATIKSPERLARMKDIDERIETYGKDFEKLVKLRREQIMLTKEVLDPSGTKLRTGFEDLQNAAASASNGNFLGLAGEGLKQVMIARLNVNKLLGRREKAAADAAEKAFADLNSVMAALEAATRGSNARKTFDEVKLLVEKYHDGFAKASQNGEAAEALVNGEMKSTAETIAADADAIKVAAIAEAQKIEQETESLIGSTERFVALLSIGGLLLGILLAGLIGRGISRPLVGLRGGMEELANGNFDVALPGLGRRDEIGEIAQAVETFKVKAEEKARHEAEAKAERDRVAAAERRSAEEREAAEKRAAAQREEAARKAAMHKLANEFEAAVGGIIETVSSASTELEAAAGTLTKTADTTQRLSTMVASASEQASANVQSVASATEEMTSSVSEIGRQVQESSKIASEAVRQAQQTDARINELSAAASRIGDVVKLITSVAEQTNLLALNATIEAARAGEAGRGFAVVAQEVKALAAQTAKATDEIGSQIAGMQTATNEAVAAIKAIGGTIGRISEISSTIAAAVEEQGAATQEISRNVGEAAKGTAEVATNITDVNRGASETGSASAQVLSSAQSLSSESNRLKLEVGKFLHTVRVA